MIQSGEGDWIIDSIPSGTESGALLVDLVHRKWGLLEGQNAFCLAAVSAVERLAAKRKNPSLCPLCLCGEKSVLDKAVRR